MRRNSQLATSMIIIEDLVIDMAAHQVNRGGNPVALSSKEYALLEYMAIHKNKVLSRTVLTEHIYAQDFDLDSNVIDVFINRIRNKIDKGFDKKLIHTLRGAGYLLKE